MPNVFPNPVGWAHAGTATSVWGSYFMGYIGVRGDGGTLWGTQARLAARNADIQGLKSRVQVIGDTAFEGKLHGLTRWEEITEVGGNVGFCASEMSCSIVMTNPSVPPQGGTAAWLLKAGIGVMCRVQGGTLAEDATTVAAPNQYQALPSFYAAYMEPNGDHRVQLVLARWVAGVETRLATFLFTPWLSALQTAGLIRMECQNSISDVTLTVKLRDIPADELLNLSFISGMSRKKQPSTGLWPDQQEAPPPPLAVVAAGGGFVTAITFVDSSGSRLATQGRGGMILDKENTFSINPTGDQVVTVNPTGFAHSLQMEGDGGIQVRDEFTRELHMGLFDANRWGEAAQDMRSDIGQDRASWLFLKVLATPWDGVTPWLGGWQGNLLKARASSASGFEVSNLPNSVQQEGFYNLSTVSMDATNQRASMGFEHLAIAGQTELRAGIVLRASQVGALAQVGVNYHYYRGYLFRMSATGVCELWRQQWAVNASALPTEDDSVLLATATISHSQVNRTIQAEVIDEPGPHPAGQGPVELRMWVDGSQIILLATGSVIGVSDDGGGVVRDADTANLIQGAKGVALYASWPATGGATTETVELTGFEKLVASVGPGGGSNTPDNDLANMAVAGEQDGVTGDLGTVFSHAWGTPIVDRKDTKQVKADQGYVQRWVVSNSDRMGYDLESRAMTSAERDTFQAFFDEHGAVVPFNWTPPRETARIWRFGSDTVEWANTATHAGGPAGSQLWQASFRVWEALG